MCVNLLNLLNLDLKCRLAGGLSGNQVQHEAQTTSQATLVDVGRGAKTHFLAATWGFQPLNHNKLNCKMFPNNHVIISTDLQLHRFLMAFGAPNPLVSAEKASARERGRPRGTEGAGLADRRRVILKIDTAAQRRHQHNNRVHLLSFANTPPGRNKHICS